LVSVLIPAFKTPKLCVDAVESVLQQDLPPGWRVEVLVGIDACDRTFQAMVDRGFDERVSIVQFATNRGPYQCLNALLERSLGDPIMILDSDDRMLPGRIEQQLVALRAGDFAAGLHLLTNDGVETRPGPPSSPQPSLSTMDYPLHSTWAVRRHVYAQLRGYQAWRCGADTDFLIRTLAAGFTIHISQIPLSVRRLRAGQMTAQGSSTGPGTAARKMAQLSVSSDLAAYRNGAPPRVLGPIRSRRNVIKHVAEQKPRIAAVMPTLPRRQRTAEGVARGLLAQGIDELVVHLQGHNKPPSWTEDPRITVIHNPSGTGPISRWRQIPEADYILSVDDDLIYPSDYVSSMVRHLRRLGPGSVVSMHCSHWPQGKSQLNERKILDFSMDTSSYVAKTYMGCGVAGFHGEDLQRVDRVPKTKTFDLLDDVWMSAAIARAGLRLYRPPSTLHWVRSTPEQTDGIFAKEKAERFFSRKKAIAEAMTLGPWPLSPDHESLHFEEIL
jgi:hypothetical protein